MPGAPRVLIQASDLVRRYDPGDGPRSGNRTSEGQPVTREDIGHASATLERML